MDIMDSTDVARATKRGRLVLVTDDGSAVMAGDVLEYVIQRSVIAKAGFPYELSRPSLEPHRGLIVVRWMGDKLRKPGVSQGVLSAIGWLDRDRHADLKVDRGSSGSLWGSVLVTTNRLHTTYDHDIGMMISAEMGFTGKLRTVRA